MSRSLDDLVTTDLTPKEKVQARIVKVSHKRPNQIVVGLNRYTETEPSGLRTEGGDAILVRSQV